MKAQSKMKTLSYEEAKAVINKEYVKSWRIQRGYYFNKINNKVHYHTLIIEEKPGGEEKLYTISKAAYEDLKPIAPRCYE